MAIESGTRLGPYEIVAPLGAGGMGEVFRARDTRLDRSVAIKVLSAAFAQNAQLRLRFEREAKTISQLEHPHICRLYDVGEAEVAGARSTTPAVSTEAQGGLLAAPTESSAISYLVMELLEGETLAARLTKGPLPIDQTLRIGVEIASALERAHKSGIVHRDLKPGNIMLTKAGTKLLDFGLAKTGEWADAFSDPNADTAVAPSALTQEGSILGTLPYMAPEQVEGREADARTDIFALGAVLYETTTGRRPFEAKTVASLTAAILDRDPPPMSRLRPSVPHTFERVVRACLAKDPDERLQSARDVRTALEWAGDETTVVELPSPRRRMLAIAAALVTIASLLVAVALWTRSTRTDVPSVSRFEMVPATNATLYPFSGPVAISPNGRMLAFFAYSEGGYLLFIRHLSSLESKPLLAAGSGGSFPFWSPDSRFVGYIAAGKLKTVDVAGGTPVTLCDTPPFAMGSWNAKGEIVFGGMGGGIFRVRADGGKPQPVTTLNPARREIYHSWPHFLPDSNRFLFLSRSADPELTGVYLGSLNSKEVKRLLSADSNAVYVEPGFLLHAERGKLLATQFNARSETVSGEPAVVAENVASFRGTGGALFSVSEKGTLAYGTAEKASTRLMWLSRTGQDLGAIDIAGDSVHVALSPDGRRLAIETLDPQSGNGTIWVHDTARNITSRLTPEGVWSYAPVWSSDGREVFYSSFGSKTGPGIYKAAADGASGEHLAVSQTPDLSWPESQSGDGSQLLFVRVDPLTHSDLWVARSGKAEHGRPLLRTEANEVQAQFSPDGRWFAYSSNESGRLEVYVRPFEEPSRKWQISSGGGSSPRWSHNGREIFFISPEQKLMAVSVQTNAELAAGSPRPLFQLDARQFFERYAYAVARDGRFLVNRSVTSVPSKIVLVSNWTSELRSRVARP